MPSRSARIRIIISAIRFLETQLKEATMALLGLETARNADQVATLRKGRYKLALDMLTSLCNNMKSSEDPSLQRLLDLNYETKKACQAAVAEAEMAAVRVHVQKINVEMQRAFLQHEERAKTVLLALDHCEYMKEALKAAEGIADECPSTKALDDETAARLALDKAKEAYEATVAALEDAKKEAATARRSYIKAKVEESTLALRHAVNEHQEAEDDDEAAAAKKKVRHCERYLAAREADRDACDAALLA